MAKLFKGKRQEVENGTNNKTSSAANPKAKVKYNINILDTIDIFYGGDKPFPI